ncbi:C4-dicarboxylate ABC transporter permease [Marinococcus halophilus]|uniref:C4-dicarboxylate ABC transporter permease n=1 Tax=Marinococcus halophilus TaxID=1371 RepID=A0A510Y6U5_MARHA|nr:tripartite tricarboxylate transporter permease [Marinococcus halophilus]OZT79728.1 C4-dicarboxylate ABC transporter permease [Marinococcus halophilus]GEK59084.1 C4-dicarboxylate ABC transporter permease [Marinococcus halophilus]
METLTYVFQFETILLLILGLLIGLFIGALPGLSSVMGVALMLPITFGMEPINGILLLIGVYFGSIYGGSLTAILINTPGTPASAASVIDGYSLTKKGLAYKALQVSTVSSAIGGVVGVILLILVAPQLAEFALRFSAPETFALALFGLSVISTLTAGSYAKGMMSGLAGLIIATVGLDPISGVTRFTFGNVQLLGGVSFIAAMIGLFATSEAFRMVEDKIRNTDSSQTINKVKLKWSEFRAVFLTILGSSGIGTFIGMIPGAGADIASFVAYNEAKRFSKNKKEFGNGSLRGLAAPEAANTGLTGGAMVPLLTLGIPGDAVTAVLLGALTVQGLQPGPQLFVSDGSLVYALFIGMLLANLFILIIGFSGIRFFTKILKVPGHFLMPVILVLSVVGAYALNNNYFDVIVMFAAGIGGYFMKKFNFPVAPLILGLILGPLLESNLRRSIILAQGDMTIFLTRPITVVLLALAVLTLLSPLWNIRKKWKPDVKGEI